MKKLLLFGLSALLSASVAHAQQPPQLEQVTPPGNKIPLLLPNLSAAAGLQAVAGKADVFTLKRGRYDAKELMQALAAKTGGKAIFADSFKTTPINLVFSPQGTAQKLINMMANYGVAALKIGGNWMFVSIENRFPQGAPLFRREVPVPAPLSPKLFGFGFNINPNPGQDLPPEAQPFDFNGERVYHVPLQPTQK